MADELNTIKTMLTSGWTAGNTDSITPTVDFVTEYKRMDLRNSGDTIVVYSGLETNVPASLGYTTVDTVHVVSIDARTSVSRDHGRKVRDEIKRIMRDNRKGDSTFATIDIVRITDLSDKSRHLYRYVIDVEMRIWNLDVT